MFNLISSRFNKAVLANVYWLLGKLVNSVFSRQTESPTFIIGTGRCGTTLLCNILKSGKQIIIFPTEANEFWHPYFYPYRPNLPTPPILINPKIFSELSRITWIDGHEKKVLYAFSGYNFLFGAHKYLLIKSAMISFIIPDILEIFPRAKFIHIYRHGIPVVNSICKKEWKKYCKQVTFDNFSLHAASYWNSCIMEIDRIDRELSLKTKGVLYELSYEDLCTNTDYEIRGIYKFIGCPVNTLHIDFPRIQNKNFKSSEITQQKYSELIGLMKEGLLLKGYQ